MPCLIVSEHPRLNVGHVEGLAYYASYFVNGDPSALTDEEIADADRFADECGGTIVSTLDGSERIGRLWDPRSPSHNMIADLVTYIVHIYPTKEG